MIFTEIEKSNILMEQDNLFCIEFNSKNNNKYIYMGEVNENKQMHGYGKLWNEIYSYHGNFINNKLNGEGILKYIGKLSDLDSSFVILYKGNFKDNKKNGYGYEIYFNKEFYKGSFFNDLRHGNGNLYNMNGEIKIKSLWELGKSVNSSFITEYYSNGCLEYRGEYNGMHRNGKGILCNKKGEIIFDGILEDGIKKEGKILNNNFIVFQGTFKDGYPSKGTFYHNNGIKLCKADVFFSKKNNMKTFYLIGLTDVFNINGNKEFSGELILNLKIKENNELSYNNLVCKYIEIMDICGNKNKFWYTYGTGINYYDNLIPSRIFKVNKESLKYEDKYISYWENSNVHEELNLVKGVISGEKKIFNKDGILNKITNYKLGLKNGNEIIFKENNLRIMETLYENDIAKHLLIFYNNSKKHYEGEINEVNNSLKYNGNGTLYYNNESNSINYQGTFLNHKYNDNGVLYYQNGNKAYDGNFLNGKKNGNGTSYYESTGTIEYSGEWINNEKHGEGSLFSETGEIVYNGNFYYDEMSFGLSN